MNKPQRIENRELLNSYHQKYCVACGKQGCDPDHIKTKGSGGNDSPENIWALCRSCHQLKHSMGLNNFVAKNKHLAQHLISKGWHYDDYFRKWRRDLD